MVVRASILQKGSEFVELARATAKHGEMLVRDGLDASSPEGEDAKVAAKVEVLRAWQPFGTEEIGPGNVDTRKLRL